MGALPLMSPIGLSDNTMGVQLAPVDPALGIELALGMLHNGFECAVGGPASEPVVYRSSNCRTVQGRLAKELLAALAWKIPVNGLPVIFRRAAAGFNFWKGVLNPLVLLVCEFIASSRHDKTARSVLLVWAPHTAFVSGSA